MEGNKYKALGDAAAERWNKRPALDDGAAPPPKVLCCKAPAEAEGLAIEDMAIVEDKPLSSSSREPSGERTPVAVPPDSGAVEEGEVDVLISIGR